MSEIRADKIHSDKNICIIQLTYLPTDNDAKGLPLLTARGSARRNIIDKPDDQVAELLATGRALQHLSQKMLRRARGREKHLDDLANGRVRSSGPAKKAIKVRKAAKR